MANSEIFCSSSAKACSSNLELLHSLALREHQQLTPLFNSYKISHFTTPPHTLEHNGTVEHRHKHVVETVLFLLNHASLPLQYWSHAFQTAAYLINRPPSSTLSFTTPFQKLFHQSPNYARLKPLVVGVILGFIPMPLPNSIPALHLMFFLVTPPLMLPANVSTSLPIACVSPVMSNLWIMCLPYKRLHQRNTHDHMGLLTPLRPLHLIPSPLPSLSSISTLTLPTRPYIPTITLPSRLDPTTAPTDNTEPMPTLTKPTTCHTNQQHCFHSLTQLFTSSNTLPLTLPSSTSHPYKETQPKPSFANASLFIYNHGGIIVYFLIYIDDIVLTGNNPTFMDHFVAQLASRFSTKDLGNLHHFLGIEVISTTSGLFLSQHRYITDLMHCAHMTGAKDLATPLRINEFSSPVMDHNRLMLNYIDN
ncbi:hypothetical protein L6164_028641 [Bauhinia variegata]|uniref:Uncharacterized protein n=1 Tax=Bauhinia variegata TaxID=167791 RepID=A0ACB9L6M7_BAUVA|nr:hypothetical protein L6164_028641 [Bauhinia variegata]